ncbi:hypothetical protein ACOJCM_05030 [Billgrantia sp. LNSP4103-1]|uniref:hypothetical protein n=1 Tax=Billgrantia sp. LNSP4103-1 TaxID=3410266 RepID=UPI00403FB997
MLAVVMLVVAGNGITVPVADATGPSPDLEATAESRDFRHLDPRELDAIRGRYVDGNSVLLFGMEMSTVWKTPGGDTLETRAGLEVDLVGAAPSVSFTPHVMATNGEAYEQLVAADGNQAAVVDAGTGNATGVVQVVQSGGDFNTAGNDFQLDINNGITQRTAAGNGRTELVGEAGASMSIQHGAGGLGMRIAMPGEGEVRQAMQPGKGLHQSVQLTGSRHDVRNLTRMQIQMDRDLGGKVSSGNLRRALDSTRGLTP